MSKGSYTNFVPDYVVSVTSVNSKVGNVSLNQDDIPSGSTNVAFTSTQQTKLGGIAVGATANQTDSYLLARANQTGVQPASTISDFSTAADARIAAAEGVASGIVPLNTLSAIDQIYIDPSAINFQLSNTVNLRAILGSGIGNRTTTTGVRGRILCVGDSFTMGFGAAGVSSAGGFANSFPSILSRLLTAKGLTTSTDYTVCDAGLAATATIQNYDPRITLGGGAAPLTSVPSLGGSLIGLTNTGDTYTFTPGTAFDRIELLYARNTVGQGNFTIGTNVDGTLSTITNSAAVDTVHTVISCSATSTSVTLTKGTGNSYFNLLGTRLSTAPKVEIINAGCSGRTVNTMALPPTGTNHAWDVCSSGAALLDSNATNCTLINGWFNDYNTGQTVSQVTTDLTTLINFFKTYGDVVYLTYVNLNANATDQDTYTNACIAAATAAGIPTINLRYRMPLYSVGQPLGMYFDSLHVKQMGQGMAARIISDILLKL